MMEFLNKQTLRDSLIRLGNDVTLADFFGFVTEQVKAAHDFEASDIHEEAFFTAISLERQDLAERCLSDLYHDTHQPDIGMLNHRVSSLPTSAIRLYASLVDMTAADKTAEDYDCFIYSMAAKGRLDAVLFCISKGFELDPTMLFTVALTNNLTADAEYYFTHFTVSFTKKRWTNFIADLAYHCWDHDSLAILHALHTYFPNKPIIGYKPMKVMRNAIQNGGIHIATFLHDNGAPLSHKKAKKDPMAQAPANTETVTWLLDKGVVPSDEVINIVLPIQAHTAGAEPLILRLIDIIGKENAPWNDMLEHACGASPKDAFVLIDFFTHLHNYSENDFKHVISRTFAYGLSQWQPVRDKIIDVSGLTVGYDIAKSVVDNERAYNKLKTLDYLLHHYDIDVTQDDSYLLLRTVDEVIRNGGRVDAVSTLIKQGANLDAWNGNIKDMVKQSNRDDLIALFS